MTKTVNDVLTNLHERAKVSITNAKLFYIINNDVKRDIQDSLFSSYSTYFDDTFRFTMFKIGNPTAALAGAAGNIDKGEYRYKITFITPARETAGGQESAKVVVEDNSSDGQVSLSVIALGNSEVTARKVYRAQDGSDLYYLLGTISDNTTTTFTDNVAQATAVTNGQIPIGVTLPSDFETIIKVIDEDGVEVLITKPIEGDDFPDKRRYWLQGSTITFDPDHPFNGRDIIVKYRPEISDVSATTDDLPYPDILHSRLLLIFTKGVSYYYLREKDSPRAVQYLEAEYIAAKAQQMQGGVVRR